MKNDPRLIRRPLDWIDLEERVLWLNDMDTRVSMPIVGPITSSTTNAWFARVLADDSRRDFVWQDERDFVMAMGGFTGIESEAGVGELYMLLNPNCRGKGMGSRVLRSLLEYGFNDIGLQRVFLWTFGSNERARRLYSRAGFKQEAHLRRHYLHRGKLEDRVGFGLLREEWARGTMS